jgi:NAD(P)-dependent dehydrogenase (short-subunit alcohol dehydrogenase family)
MSDSVAPAYAILGATGGIGSEVCRRLAAGGARLAIGARDEARLDDLAAGLDATARSLDAADFDAVDAFLGEALERFGRLDGVVNCVGSVYLRPAHLTPAKDLHSVLATNLVTAFAAVRGAARRMKQGGSVVLISTAAGRTGLPSHEAIAAAKGGVEGLVRSAAATYARAGLRVNAVAPGLVETPATERITSNEAGRAASLSMHALGRLGRPADVASAIVWLLDPANDWVTGQVLAVDGGLGSVRVPARA